MKYYAVLIVSLLAAILIICTFLRRPVRVQTGTNTVSVSFYPLGEFTRRIGGSYINVSVITPSGIEPHDYEPTARDIITIQSSSLFIYNGNGVDSWADKIIPELAHKGVRTLKMKDALKVSSPDPHMWLDPILAIQMVDHIKASLIAVDPTHKAAYQTNAEQLVKDLTTLDHDIRAGLTNCTTKEIVVSHDAFGYFTKRYGLTQRYIAGISPEDEPSPKELAAIATDARLHNVKYIFFEPLAPAKLSDTIAREVGAQTLVLNPIEGVTEKERKQGYNYFSIMKDNLTNLRKALTCR